MNDNKQKIDTYNMYDFLNDLFNIDKNSKFYIEEL